MLHSWRPSGAQHLPCTSSDALRSPLNTPFFRLWWCAPGALILAVVLTFTHSLKRTVFMQVQSLANWCCGRRLHAYAQPATRSEQVISICPAVCLCGELATLFHLANA